MSEGELGRDWRLYGGNELGITSRTGKPFLGTSQSLENDYGM